MCVFFFTEITVDVIAAQAFIFFSAGYGSSSSVMTFCLYELAMNPSIQGLARSEIDSVTSKHDGLTYEALQDMKYLDKVINGKIYMHFR